MITASDVKQLPLGISDFTRLVRENYYYVDKTMFIPRLETTSSYLFLVRPRRFGKSLLLNMLMAYYDVNMKDRFSELFGHLWIGSNPTPFQGRYAVMHLDFSQVTGSIDELVSRFNQYCSMIVNGFGEEYEHLFYPGFAQDVKHEPDANAKINFVGYKAKVHDVPMYLIIDEYDNFTNTVLNQHGENIYTSLTHGEGFYRDIFKLFKPNFERVLMLGVSPVTMDDLTSGYNIATNITADAAFNQMLGFSEEEVHAMFCYYRDAGCIRGDIDAMLDEMRPWYDNYCFARASLATESKVYNSNMVLYYLSNQIRNGCPPDEMTDPNARTDYQKMKKLIQLDRLEPQRKSIIYQIAEQGYIDSTLVPYFPASDIVKFDNFVSLLYYYGMLTITGMRGNKLRLGIPNNNVRKQYYGYLLEEYDRIRHSDHQRIDSAFDSAALDGDWSPLIHVVADEYEKTCAVRCLIEGERNIQGFFTAYLTMSTYYLTAPELELAHGYCDFFLMPDLRRYPMVAHSYIIELKYLKPEATRAEAEAQWSEAEAQVRHYATDSKLPQLCGPTQLHLIVAQFRGHHMERSQETEP